MRTNWGAGAVCLRRQEDGRSDPVRRMQNGMRGLLAVSVIAVAGTAASAADVNQCRFSLEPLRMHADLLYRQQNNEDRQ